MPDAKVIEISTGAPRDFCSTQEQVAECKASFLAELDRIRQGVESGTVAAMLAVTIHGGEIGDPDAVTIHYERCADVTKLRVRGALWWLDNYFRNLGG